MAASATALHIADPDADKSSHVIASTACGFAIATTAIVLRLFCRWLCRKRLELNDYLILAAYPFKLAIDVTSVLLIHYGIGRHVTALTLDDITNFLKVEYVGSFVYAPCIGFTKLSILSLFWAAFPFKHMRYGASITGALVFCWAVACCLVGLFDCIPIHKSWQPEIPGHCIDLLKYYYGLQIPNIVTDVMILLLPIKAVYDLGLPWKQTMALSTIFMLAVVTIAFDIVRLVVLVNIPNTPDFSWNLVSASVWTDIEPSIGILVACLPVMRPLLNLRTFWHNRTRRTNAVDEYNLGSDANTVDNYHYSKNEDVNVQGYNRFSDS